VRILIIVHQFRPEYATGTETAMLNVAKACQRAGHPVTILTCALHDPSRWTVAPEDGLWFTVVEGVPIYAIPSALVSDPLSLHEDADSVAKNLVQRFLYERNFDVTHIGHSLRMFSAIEALREANLPYVITLTDFFPLCYRINMIRISGELCDGPHCGRACLSHCPAECEAPERFERFRMLLAGAEARVVVSDFTRRQYARSFPDLAFETLPHGIDVLRACKISAQKSERPGVRFGFLGTLSAIKGVALLAEAFAAAELADSSLEIVGPTHDNPQTTQAIEAIATAHPNITIRGPVAPDAVFDVISRFDVICLPSQVPETYSLVLHQAFACGIPALVSDLGAPAEIVERGGCGWTVPHADVAGWAQSLRRVATDRALLEAAKSRVPLPLRLEEEGFFYEQLYRRAVRADAARRHFERA
jgi:glycosyltransferase involved in cell wall biosynthesis